jgi:hypothetical protein
MDIHNFKRRLNETISWCSSQELISDPVEDARIVQRRAMSRRAAELMGSAYRIFSLYERSTWILRLMAWSKIRRATKIKIEAERLMAAADPGSIVPPLRHQLRSEVLRPFAQDLARSCADHASIVAQVAEARSEALRQSGKGSNSQSPDLCNGGLLLFAPEDNLSDGAAEYASMGFFDVENVPPWDTWIAMFGKYLVSWVPPQLIRLVQEGLDVNPEQCILLADDPSLSNQPITAILGELTSKVA